MRSNRQNAPATPNMPEQSFFITALGCKVSQYEAQALREAWCALGYSQAESPAKAATIVVYSCAVTAKALADVRATIRRMHRAAPHADIVVSGCAAEVADEELTAMPGVTHALGKSAKASLLRGLPVTSEALTPPGSYPAFSLSGSERSRATLKIQDGCSHGCTYCIVPLARGRSSSRPYAESLAEAKRLLQAGFREIVISGINLRQYQDAEFPGKNGFWHFLQKLERDLANEWAGQARFRISSLEPGQLNETALATLAESRLIAPHLHLSLQSGSYTVLSGMGRGHYHPEDIFPFLESLRSIWPIFGLGADILAGFPGETHAAHQETLEFCRALPLSYAHVFPYSKRPGTRAALMPEQIPQDMKKARAAELRALVDEKRKGFLQALCAKERLQVVFEERPGQPGQPVPGTCEHYADCRLQGKSRASREIVSCKPLYVEQDQIVVAPAEK